MCSVVVATPATEPFRDGVSSRLLRQFPLLVEVVYWALMYWVCNAWLLTSPTTDIAFRFTAWQSLYARDYTRQHGSHCLPPCLTASSSRAMPSCLHRTRVPSIFRGSSDTSCLDESSLLVRSHPSHHWFPHLAFVLHKYRKPHPPPSSIWSRNYPCLRFTRRPWSLRSTPPHHGSLQRSSIHDIHHLAMYATTSSQRPKSPRTWCG